MALGGDARTVGDTVVVTFPDVLVLLDEGESSGGTEGSILNHMAFRVQSLDDVAAAGLALERLGSAGGIANVFSPGSERIELFDETATNLTFTRADGGAPTKGRMLDHIGFEVENLERFCRALEAQGVTFDVPYRRSPAGIGHALLTDPWGTSIALTEGLRDF